MKKHYGKRAASWLRQRWLKLKAPLVWIIALGGFAAVVYRVCFASYIDIVLPRAWAFLILCGGVGVLAIALTIIVLIITEQGRKEKG